MVYLITSAVARVGSSLASRLHIEFERGMPCLIEVFIVLGDYFNRSLPEYTAHPSGSISSTIISSSCSLSIFVWILVGFRDYRPQTLIVSHYRSKYYSCHVSNQLERHSAPSETPAFVVLRIETQKKRKLLIGGTHSWQRKSLIFVLLSSRSNSNDEY